MLGRPDVWAKGLGMRAGWFGLRRVWIRETEEAVANGGLMA